MAPALLFRDRTEAGEILAHHLEAYRGRARTIVLGLPRGGVPVAAAVAGALDLPLDVFVVRKLGVPGHEELAFGAVASGGGQVLNEDVVDAFRIRAETIESVASAAHAAVRELEDAFRGPGTAPLDLTGRTVILVDDGLATGATMRAAMAAVRVAQPSRLVVAVPVGARPTCRELQPGADEVVCAESPHPFTAVGRWYDDFSPTSDDEVRAALALRRRPDGE